MTEIRTKHNGMFLGNPLGKRDCELGEIGWISKIRLVSVQTQPFSWKNYTKSHLSKKLLKAPFTLTLTKKLHPTIIQAEAPRKHIFLCTNEHFPSCLANIYMNNFPANFH
jgi:hypothetical protein